ncbi:uncharacterized protein LOC128186852 [Crassostrea angulata]|uniref:uncharacterized protein LOC128186852 n=1 Tax=Magallana angulata TaxID=2784310 RepID=UPI0022B1AD49|nr:uncharacterized protein LOC128186852 [Crassostrea angulata]
MTLVDSNIVMHWIFVYLSAGLSICLSTNVTVLRIATGASFGIYDFYLHETLFGGFPNSSSQQFKSEIINDWETTNIQEVTIKIYTEENITAFFVFDGRNTHKTNWMSKERFKGSSYTDLTTSTVDSLGYLQISFQSVKANRRFYIAYPHNGCNGDTGWLLVKESVLTKPCKVDQVSETTIWYSGSTKKDYFNNYLIADLMTVEVNIDVTCDDRDLRIDNAVYNVTGNQFNDSVKYRCLGGFNHTSGDLYRQCNHLGHWTGTSPTCSAVCDITSLHIDNANYTKTGNLYNDSVTYRCLEGSNHTSGDLYRRCNHLGNWTGTSPTCTRPCHCPCGSNEYIKVNDTEALQARLEEIKSKLSIKANETSKARRSKVCAMDERTSAKAVGSILGGLLIGSFVLFIIASDVPLLLREIKKGYRNIRS